MRQDKGFNMVAKRLLRQILSAMAFRVPGCSRLLRTTTPLPIQRHPSTETPDRSCDLIVLLPGIHDLPEQYKYYGFLETLQRGGMPAEVVTVDAHYGYYASRTVLERLREDLIVPARERGCGKIRLVGISMGGLGALLYASRFPGEIETVVALAPFLGRSSVIREITEAGGLKRWEPERLDEHDHERRLWQWLKRYETPAPDLPRLYLGFGERDKFALGHCLLAQLLPAERVFMTQGRHDWQTWKRLWELISGSDAFGDRPNLSPA